MQASNIIMTYFVIGAVMWGGGALALDDAGVVGAFVEQNDGDLSTNQSAADKLSGQAGIIQSTAALAVGGLLFVINLAKIFFTYMNWPLVVFFQHNAPPALTVLLGGSLTAGFYLSMFSIIR